MPVNAGTGRPDVLIVGGGVVGCAVGRALAGRGLRVTIAERGRVGEEASAAAAGLLSPQSDGHAAGPLFDLLLASHRLYPDWARALEEETGQPVGYRRTGLLRCALSEPEEARLSALLPWQLERGLSVEWRDAEQLSKGVGLRVSPEARAGAFFPDEGLVDPRRLTRALAASAGARGVTFCEEAPVRRFWIERGRCRGVETDSGRLEAGRVVDAAGAWAFFDAGLPFVVPVEPVRGQIVELDPQPERLAVVLQSENVYLAPHADGRLLVGSTLERVGFRKEVTASAVRDLLAAATRLAPPLAAARLVTAWAGLRPATPDGLPILGGCDVEGLFLAAGHFRNGILLAPITAALMADALTGAAPADLEPFSVARFGATLGPTKSPTPPAEVFG